MVNNTQVGPLATQSVLSGVLSFADEGSRLVSFSTPQPNVSYRVLVRPQADSVYFWVTNKTVNGFVINTFTSYTGQVGFDAFE